MRRVPRLRQPSLLAASSTHCTCTAAPATLPIQATARRALSTTPAAHNRLRKALWKGGEVPGPEDPYAPESSQALRQQQLERELAEAEAELAAYEADAQHHVKTQKTERERRHVTSRLTSKIKNPRVWAPTEKEGEAKGYVPAQTSAGLEEIGGLEGWWEQEGRWGKESQYVAFAQGGKVLDAGMCEVLVRQAVVEVLAVQGTRPDRLTGTWVKGSRKNFDRAMAAGLAAQEDGSVALECDAELAAAISRVATVESKETEREAYLTPEEAKERVQQWDPTWKSVSLQDTHLKFAIHKRVFQLTGHHVHDAKLAQVETVADLISIIAKPPKPAKLAEEVRERGELLELPNVRVHDRRVTPIDKETAVGRWKVITEELEKRGLPVTGHEHLPKPVQRKWIQGRT
ncbi:ribosomal subunit 39S-domain-containing protein [Colletotrichum cereale]|nr:ribosomal subunit 39S-domain-containing protein [Colletotrichum cereale]